jgi:hypothetical protein
MNRLKLPSGLRYGYDCNGQRVCVGASMGRKNILPVSNQPMKLQMEKLAMCDGYDAGGAYWGHPNNLYCAWNGETRVFVRAESRKQAKDMVRAMIISAKFYR